MGNGFWTGKAAGNDILLAGASAWVTSKQCNYILSLLYIYEIASG